MVEQAQRAPFARPRPCVIRLEADGAVVSFDGFAKATEFGQRVALIHQLAGFERRSGDFEDRRCAGYVRVDHGERVGDLAPRGRAVVRLLRQAAQREIAQVSREGGGIDGAEGRLLVEVGADPRLELAHLKDVLPGQHLVEQAAKSVDVGTHIHVRRATLLRRHVGGGAEDRADAGQALVRIALDFHVDQRFLHVERAHQAEIGHFGDAVVGDEDIGGLEVAVNQAGDAASSRAASPS